MEEKRTCKHCGKQFTPVTEWQEFHSDNCRQAYWRKQEKERVKQMERELEELRKQTAGK